MKSFRILVISSLFAAFAGISYAGGAGCTCGDKGAGDKAPAPTPEKTAEK